MQSDSNSFYSVPSQDYIFLKKPINLFVYQILKYTYKNY